MKKQKGGKRTRSVSRGFARNLSGTTEGIESKGIFRKNKRGKVVRKERVDVLAESDERINDEDATGSTRKGVISTKKKTVKNKEGEYTKRKERVLYDDGLSSVKRKQKKIRFGKNKGKVRSKTVSWKDGKRTVTKSINDKMNKQKLQKGGFLLEPGIESID
tara:strand:- start:361 stop:843 length:483 start_codon:yes stop_codon:yes gene_type:complete